MDVATNTQIPRPRDGRAELAALALAIAASAEQRDAPVLTDPGLPAEAQSISPPALSSRRGVAATAIAGAAATAALVFVLTAPHPARAHAASRAVASSASSAARSPAATLGARAGRRLSAGGRPVTSYGCESAYAADAAAFPTLLAPDEADSSTRAVYIRGCLSGMS